jgi:signal transduction histidine kinase
VVFTCRDDGAGVDVESVRRALAQGGHDAARLGDAEVLERLLHGGISTSSGVTPLSGRGVGLDVMREAGEQLGGRVTLDSVRGKGLSVELCVPLSILLIDDSPTCRAVLKQALEQDGYRVSTASSGEEGLRVAAMERPDAIIVDGELPGMDGSTVIRHVRLDAALRRVVCLLLTDQSEMDAELRALDSGADAFVNKSEDAAVLLAKLRAVLRMAQTTRADDETRSLLSPSRILAVDDSTTYREAIGSALRAEGYDVIQVASGEEALEILAHRSRERIEIRTEFGEPDAVECYPGLLNQAVMNLVSNSIDAIAERGTIVVRTGTADGAYQIQVSDTGSGIPPQLRDRVREPFFTTKPVGEGTGLGLSITYSIVRKHGGTLDITCPEAGGTTVTIRFPFRRSAHPEATGRRESSKVGAGDRRERDL